jgi:hypothetical protein
VERSTPLKRALSPRLKWQKWHSQLALWSASIKEALNIEEEEEEAVEF